MTYPGGHDPWSQQPPPYGGQSSYGAPQPAPNPHAPRRRWSVATLITMLGVVALVAGAVTACTSASSKAPTPEIPLQSGEQTVLFELPPAIMNMAVGAENTIYFGGSLGIWALAPGADTATPFNGHPLSTLAAAPDGTLFFVDIDGIVQKLAPGSPTPQPLPFDKLRYRSQIAAGPDGAVYLGDNERGKLLKLEPGASSPTELPVEGLNGIGLITVDAEDNVYVTVMGKVMKVTRNGAAAETVEGAPNPPGGLAVDVAGNLYATNRQANTVLRRSADGGEWETVPFKVENPGDIVVDGAGNVFVEADIRWKGPHVIRLAAT